MIVVVIVTTRISFYDIIYFVCEIFCRL